MSIPATGEGHREAQRDYRAQLSKLWWAGSIVNGAGLIGLLQLIGNVDDPDAAFTALRWPVILMGSGLGMGLIAITTGLISNLHAMNVGQAEDHALVYANLKAETNEVRSKIKNADNPTLEMISIPKLEDMIAELTANQNAQAQKWLTEQREQAKMGSHALSLSSTSCFLFALALVVAIGGHSLGVRIQPANPRPAQERLLNDPATLAPVEAGKAQPSPSASHSSQTPKPTVTQPG